jgi:wobble nucleotide-excising tRNase
VSLSFFFKFPLWFYRGIVGYVAPFIFIVFAVVMLWHKYIGGEKLLEVLEVKPPPSKNAVEQILTLQEAISKLEDFLQAANITLLKFRAVLFASVPKVCLWMVLFVFLP